MGRFLGILWLVILCHGAFNIGVVGFGPGLLRLYQYENIKKMSAERQESLKSLNPKALDDPDPDWFGGSFKTFSWLLWLFELSTGIIPIFFAFKFASALHNENKIKREERQGGRLLREDWGRTPSQGQQRPEQTTAMRPQQESSLNKKRSIAKSGICFGCQGAKIRQCSSCGGSGGHTCNSCNGDTFHKCPLCGGDGFQGSEGRRCRQCHGAGGRGCSSCGQCGWQSCRSCNGKGSTPCSKCNGTGKYPPPLAQ